MLAICSAVLASHQRSPMKVRRKALPSRPPVLHANAKIANCVIGWPNAASTHRKRFRVARRCILG
jgi:hypothetical protein